MSVVRIRRLRAALPWLVLIPAGLDILVIRSVAPSPLAFRDFLIDYVAGLLTRTRGAASAYDLDAQRAMAMAIRPEFHHFYPFASAPLLAWLAIPFGYMSFEAAVAGWTVLLSACLFLCWALLAPGRGAARGWHLLAALGMHPVVFSLLVGQVVPVVMLGVVLCWYWLRQGRQLPAGAALGLALSLKPQLVFLLPPVLFALGARRALAMSIAVPAVLAVISLLLLGPGIAAAWTSLNQVRGLNDPSLDLSRMVGPVLGAIARFLVVAAVAVVALRTRGGHPERAMAAAILGSLVASPYLHLPDLAMLLIAGWLTLRGQTGPDLVTVMIAAYLLSWLIFGAILVAELVWLVLLVADALGVESPLTRIGRLGAPAGGPAS